MTSGLLKAISKQTGLVYDAKRNIVHGSYQGIPVAIKETGDREVFVIVPAKQPNATDNSQTESFLNGLKQSIPQIKRVAASQNCITSVIKIGIYRKAIGVTINTLSQIVSFCKSSNMVTCCQNCGIASDTAAVSTISVDGTPYMLCNTCATEMENNIEQTRKNIKSKKVNFIGGLVGAFLGSLIGVALWVVIYQLGYIAAVSGLAFTICTIKGFEKFGGKLNVAGLITSLIVAVGMLYIAENISLAIEIYKECKTEYDITFFDAYKAIGVFMQEPEVSRNVICDLAMGYLMMALASISPVIQMFKASNNIVEVTKLGETQKSGPAL